MLSEIQRLALEAIAKHGNVAVAAGGGFWKSLDGKRLTFKHPRDSWNSGDIGTSTIYALEDRGLLEPIDYSGPYKTRTRAITPAGREALND